MSRIDDQELSTREKDIRLRIASRVEELRRRDNVTLRYLADASGVSHPQLSAMLVGKRNVTIGTLIRLAYAFDVDVVDLLKAGPVVRPSLKKGRPNTRRLRRSSRA